MFVHCNSLPIKIAGLGWLLVFCDVLTCSVAAQQPPVHPWIAKAPGEFMRLIDRGNVSITVDDQRIRKAGKTALTLFHFVIDYDLRFRHQLLGFDEKSKTWQAKITSWMDQPKVRLEHTICFQSNFTPNSPWESRLVKHEFDHVAISSDPRLLKIIKRILEQRKQWTARWNQVEAPTEADIKKSILDNVVEEVKSFEQMVQSQYDYLDKESSQGVSTIENRSNFFQSLYTLEGLERCKFEMEKTTKAYIKDKLTGAAVDKEVKDHYLFLSSVVIAIPAQNGNSVKHYHKPTRKRGTNDTSLYSVSFVTSVVP